MSMQEAISKRYQALLSASLSIHRFLLGEEGLAELLQGTCDRLVQNNLNQAVWIVLLGSDMGGAIAAEAGFGERFNAIRALLKDSQLPDCGRRCLESPETGHVVCRHCSCGVCSTDADGQGKGIAVAIRCRPGLKGFLFVEYLSSLTDVKVEAVLYEQIAHSLGQAVRRLLAVDESKRREQELKQVEERFELALYASQAGLWDWNIKSGEMYASPERKKYLDYREEGETVGVSALQGIIHPDDQDNVLQVLNDHLAGKSDEYRIEYRIKDRQGEWRWFLDRGKVVERDEKNMPVRMTGTHQDITRQKKQDEALITVQRQLHEAVDHERTFLQSVIDGAADPVMAIDNEYNILLMNKVAAQLQQVDPETVRSGEQKCYRQFAGKDRPCTNRRYPCPVREVRNNGRAVTLVHNPYHGNGINNTFEVEVSPLRDKTGAVYGIIEVARDITDRLRIEKELRESRSRFYRLAHHDSLTGLPNRLLFKDRLEQAILKARRTKTMVAILFLDLDRFKIINDTLGHDVGDALLVEVAARLQALCRRSDTVARIGGDEFVFVLDNIRDRESVERIAGKIIDAMKRPVRVNNNVLNVSTSIGIALYPEDSDEINGVIKCADTALYQAKNEGRSNFKLYSPEMVMMHNPLQIQEQHLRKALQLDQFFLEYQCQFELSTGKVVGMEALLRWRHPEQGVLYPADFLYLAEGTDIIVDIGHWVLERVCSQLVSWQQDGIEPVPIAVNISSRQLRHPGFQPMISSLLTKHALSAHLLEIELDEAAMMEGYHAEGLHGLKQISRLGVRLAVEDFGSGRFSLGDLQRFPLSRLKIDSSFMGRLSDNNIAVIVDAIIVLAHNLGITVLAEGVEKEDQLQFLHEHHCDQAQGFFLARPAEAGRVDKYLKGKLPLPG